MDISERNKMLDESIKQHYDPERERHKYYKNGKYWYLNPENVTKQEKVTDRENRKIKVGDRIQYKYQGNPKGTVNEIWLHNGGLVSLWLDWDDGIKQQGPMDSDQIDLLNKEQNNET